jgi:hypothetical protein
MQKTYWWRIVVLFLGIVVFGWGYLVVNAFDLGLCGVGKKCFFNYGSYVDPLMFLSLALFVITPFLFFINDLIFKKWLHFAIAWFMLAAIFITLAPVYSGGYIGLNPTKESVSIWMGSLFVIISIIQIAWLSKKQ